MDRILHIIKFIWSSVTQPPTKCEKIVEVEKKIFFTVKKWSQYVYTKEGKGYAALA